MTTETEAPRARVKDALGSLRARITAEHDNGEFDFLFDGITGFARDSRGRFRASFFLDYDPDPLEAESWVAAHDDVAYAEAQLIELPDGAALRVLVDLPFEDRDEIQSAARTVLALNAAWQSRHERGSGLVATLGSAGVAVPPLGSASLSSVATYGPWSWGSRYLPPMVLYMFEAEFVARQLIEHGPMFVMSHAGHGINSYGLNVVTTSTSGAVAAYVQHGFGGAYANPVGDLIDINATYSRLRVLLDAIDEVPVETARWLLLYSSFRGECGLVDLEKLRDGGDFEHAIERFDSETALFEAVVARLQLRAIDFGSGRNVPW